MTIDYDKIKRQRRQRNVEARKKAKEKPRNPLPPKARHRRKFVTEEELKALRVVASRNVFDHALVLAVYNCALRASEVGKLTLGHARFVGDDPSQLFCVRAKKSVDGWIELHSTTKRALLTWIATCYPDLNTRKADDWLFPGSRYRGRPAQGIARWAVARHIARLGKLAGLPPEIAHPHALRHGRVMHILEAAEKTPNFHWPTLIPTLQKFLGHASAETTLNNYLHQTRGVGAIEADVLSGILGDDDD